MNEEDDDKRRSQRQRRMEELPRVRAKKLCVIGVERKRNERDSRFGKVVYIYVPYNVRDWPTLKERYNVGQISFKKEKNA